MNRFTIGILGGMGPRATVYFEQRLLDRFKGDDQDLPRIVSVNDGSIPDRSAFLCDGGEDPLDALLASAQLLAYAQPDVVCLPCNTAHSTRILSRLQALAPLPILDMPAAALAAAVSAGYERVLILGTEGTKRSGVYGDRAVGITCLYPDQDVQDRVTQLIRGTKRRGFRPSARDELGTIITATAADAVILACTELSLLNQGLQPAKPVIDALEALVTGCVDRAASYTNE